MSKLLFIQDVPYESFGIEYISAHLKSQGHQTDLVILNQEKKGFDVLDYIRKSNPQVIGFSVSTIDVGWAKNIARRVRADVSLKDTVIIFGGSHPTMHPEFIEEEDVDMICVGEGEYAFAEMMDKLAQGSRDFSSIENFHLKHNGQIIRNPMRPLVENHDLLPFADRSIYYDKYPLLRNMTTKKFYTGRGCAYKCTFCNHEYFQKRFSGLGKYVTYRDPVKVIEEIKEVKEKYGLKYVYFGAETLTTNHRWLTDLLDLYKKEVGIPFSCMSRPNELNEDIVKKLADAGCYYTSFGLETGSERIRNGLLKRDVSDAQLLKSAELLHKYKIKFLLHQMFVLPTETPQEAFETIAMDIKMRPHTVWSTIYQPTVGTSLREHSVNQGLLVEDPLKPVDSIYSESLLNQPYVKELTNLQKLVYLCLKFPWVVPMVKKLINLPANPLFELVNKWGMASSFRHRYRLGYLEMFLMYLGSNKRFG
jgi:radical SAM superfamily enzyme YgiQ (UPF0313 family)